MKILMALQGLEIGGAETHVIELSKEMKRRGHDVIMLSGGGVYLDEVEKAGIRHYTVPVKQRKVMDIIKAKGMIKDVLVKEKPDLVHAHARIPAFLLGSLHKEMGKPFVYVTTAHWTFDTPFLVKHLTNWGEKTLCVSDDIKKYLLKNYPEVKEENIYISINGIDGNKFSKTVSPEKIINEFKLDTTARRIVYVSRLNPAVCAPAYGLIEKAEEINNAVGKVEIVIVGAGDCFDDMKQKAEAVNKKLGRNAVILTGGRTDINEILASADVCVGVSRAILEPMMMEKRCVIAGQEGYLGILTPEKLDTAILCNFTCRGCAKLDFDVLKDDVIKLFNMTDEEAKEVTDYSKYVVETYYSIKKMADDNEKMYNDAIRDLRCEAAILGYYGYENSGDDALLEAIISDMKELDSSFAATVLSHTPQKTALSYNTQSIDRFNIWRINNVLKRVKLLIVGGGSLVQDVTSTKSLLYYLTVIQLAKKHGVKVMLYANGIGPITKNANVKKAARVLNTVDVITLRDEESAELLKSIGVNKPYVEVTADPAFSLKKDSNGSADKLKKQYGFYGKEYLCVSVRGFVNDNDGEKEKNIANLLDYICNKKSLIPVFVPMQMPRDIQKSRDVMAYMNTPATIIEQKIETSDMLEILAGADSAVAVRLHMLIFGAIAGLPVLGIEYDPKVKAFQEYIGQPYTISVDDIKSGNFKENADKFIDDCSKIKEHLNAVVDIFAKKAKRNAHIAHSLIKGEEY